MSILLILLMTASIATAEILADVSITADKSSYKIGEIATLTLSINNTGFAPMKNVSVSNFLPNDLVYVDENEAMQTIPEIKVGETAKRTIRVKMSDTSVIPGTGDKNALLIWLSLALTALGIIALIGRRRRMVK